LASTALAAPIASLQRPDRSGAAERCVALPILGASMVMVGHAQRLAQPLSRAQRRAIAVVLIAVIGGCAFLIARSSAPASRNGCITVTFPGSMGSQVISHCGGAARSACAAAYAQRDPLSRLTQTQCRLAGIRPRGSASR
jgi:hypothetical protein